MANLGNIAALFVDRRGPYYDMGLDCYDVERDARTFDFSKPAVMHPPCKRWSVLMYPLLEKGYRIGDDDGMFKFSLDVLRLCGGVIEHPAHSIAWDWFDLPKPARGGWQMDMFSEFASTEVDQGNYGHMAKKTTWLLMRKRDPLPALDWRAAGNVEYVVQATRRTKAREMPKKMRHITPFLFAKTLADVAKMCLS